MLFLGFGYELRGHTTIRSRALQNTVAKKNDVLHKTADETAVGLFPRPCLFKSNVAEKSVLYYCLHGPRADNSYSQN